MLTVLGARLAINVWEAASDLMVLFVAAMFIAFAIDPAVTALQRRGVRRGVAAAGVMFAGVLSFAALVVAIGAVVVSQASQLREKLPLLAQDAVRTVNKAAGTAFDVAAITRPGGTVDKVSDFLSGAAVHMASSALGVLGQVLTVLFIAFYLSAEGPRLLSSLCSLLPPDRQGEVLRVFETAVAKTGGYLSSRTILAGASALVHSLVLFLLGVPYAIPLGLWVGVVSQLIPVVGTYLAAVVPLLIALSTGSVSVFAVTLTLIVLYQQFENNLLSPRVTRVTVNVHPVLALLAAVIGSRLAGPAGALLAIPFAATAVAVFGAYVTTHDVVTEPGSQRLDRFDGPADTDGREGT